MSVNPWRVTIIDGKSGAGHPIIVTRDVTKLPSGYWLPTWARTPEQQAACEAYEA